MKAKTTLLAVILLISAKVFSQTADTVIYTATGGTDRGEYLINDFRLGVINYPRTSTHLTILIRKARNMHTGIVSKGMVLAGTSFDPINSSIVNVFCFVGEEELDDAIRSLQLISDSLLATTPDHSVEYYYNFPNTPGQFFANYNIYFADGKPKWTIVFDFDRFTADASWTNIDPKDIPSFINFFKVAKEKLKGY